MREDNIAKKRLSFLDYVKTGATSVYQTFLRFPLTILLFIALGAITIYRVEIPYYEGAIHEIINRLTAVLLFGITLSLSVQMLFERFFKNINFSLKIIIYLVELAVLVGYYYLLFPESNLVTTERILLISIALILSFLFVPYLLKRKGFEIYITKIITRAVTTVFFTVVLGLGLSAILFAIESLLYSDLKSEFYIYTWILAGTIFAPIYFLYGLPKQSDEFNESSYNKVLQVMLVYIILPLLTVFTIVLYIYFAKIIITQVWPKGIVSYLVLSYTAVGLTSIFLISPLRMSNRWIKIFISVFTKAIFPLLAIMFMSIAIRIGDYGFTENRYYILIIGIWSTFAVLFINFNRNKNNIVLPISLAIVAFLTVVGPWSAFNVSIASQSERFFNILSKYDMIENGKVIKNNDVIVENSDKREITGILRYFYYSHKFEDLKYLPTGFTFNDMENFFGFYEYEWNDVKYYDQVNYYRIAEKPFIITGYDVFYDFKSYMFYNDATKNDFIYNGSNYKIKINKDYSVGISRDGTEVYSVKLKDYIEFLYNKYGNTIKGDSVNSDDLIFIDENDEIEVMYAFNQIYGLIVDDELKLENIEVQIYINIKEDIAPLE